MKKGILALLTTLCLLGCCVPASAAQPAPGAELQERFDRLTEQQKQELYARAAAVTQATRALLEQYAAAGVLDKTAAEGICAALEARLAQDQTDGRPAGLTPPRTPPGRKDAAPEKQ